MRRNYAGVMDGYSQLAAKEGGVSAYFKGVQASILRSLVMNTGELLVFMNSKLM